MTTDRRRLAPGAPFDDDAGFTLLEVMVVVLVIGVLLAIAIPTYLGSRDRAHDRAAEVALRSGLATAAVVFTDRADFGDADPAGLAEAEPGYTYVGPSTASDADTTLSVAASGDGSTWGAAVRSETGTCFYVRVSADQEPEWTSSATAACTGTQALVFVAGSGAPTVNVAAGSSATSTHDHYVDQPGSLAFDGNRTDVTSRWVSPVATPSLQPSLTVDLGGRFEVSGLQMWNGWQGYNNPFPGYTVDYWDDAAGTWRRLYERTDNTDAVIDETFPPVETSQLRITITDGRARLYEVEVVGR